MKEVRQKLLSMNLCRSIQPQSQTIMASLMTGSNYSMYTGSAVDLSGYYLSDSKKKLSKWQFPQGTSIAGNGYLIIWADKDTTQFGLHANFKLSSGGEEVLLSKPDVSVIDKVVFPAQNLELSFSRSPNGTGSFKWQTPTFNRSNDMK